MLLCILIAQWKSIIQLLIGSWWIDDVTQEAVDCGKYIADFRGCLLRVLIPSIAPLFIRPNCPYLKHKCCIHNIVILCENSLIRLQPLHLCQ